MQNSRTFALRISDESPFRVDDSNKFVESNAKTRFPRRRISSDETCFDLTHQVRSRSEFLTRNPSKGNFRAAK